MYYKFTPIYSDQVDSSSRTTIDPEIGNANDRDVLKCLDIWEFIKAYCPTSIIPVDELKQRGRTLATDFELEFNEYDEFAVGDLQDSPNSVPTSSKIFGTVPSRSELNEPLYFKAFVEIGNKIKTSVKNNNSGFIQTNNVMLTVHSRSLHSHISGSILHIDGTLVKDPNGPEEIVASELRPTDALIVMAYEKSSASSAVIDNRLKVLSAAAQIMHDDVRRMFIYSISIEDCWMTVWYFARDHCVRATFNWWERKATMISILLALMCASNEDFGLDPRVHLLAGTNSEHPQFIYELQSPTGREHRGNDDDLNDSDRKAVFYRTVAPIWDWHDLRITGRNTRVFKVVQVDSASDVAHHDDRPLKVLKDAWMDDTAQTEWEIQTHLFADIKRFVEARESEHAKYLVMWSRYPEHRQNFEQYLSRNGSNGPKDFKHLFLCIKFESTGPPLRKMDCDHLSYPASTFLPPNMDISNRAFKPTAYMSTLTRPEGNEEICVAQTPLPSNRDYLRRFPRKKRSFILFEDVCTPVYELPNLGTAYQVLSQTVIALFLMWGANWVHRDISVGNVMAIQNTATHEWEARLGDFEFAKVFAGDSANADGKFGTPYFMAAEVLRGAYFPVRLEWTMETLFANAAKLKEGDKLHFQSSFPMIHNFYHDVESLYWIAFWLMTCWVGHLPSQMRASPIFSRDMGSNFAREQALSSPISDAIHNASLPQLNKLWPTLDCLRTGLWQDLLNRNDKQNWMETFGYSQIHWFAYCVFCNMAKPGSEWFDVKLQESISHKAPDISSSSAGPENNRLETVKRGLEDAEDKDDKDRPAKRPKLPPPVAGSSKLS